MLEDDIGPALARAHKFDGDNDAVILACAAKIVGSYMFRDTKQILE